MIKYVELIRKNDSPLIIALIETHIFHLSINPSIKTYGTENSQIASMSKCNSDCRYVEPESDEIHPFKP